jgi:hypothetical protein
LMYFLYIFVKNFHFKNTTDIIKEQSQIGNQPRKGPNHN